MFLRIQAFGVLWLKNFYFCGLRLHLKGHTLVGDDVKHPTKKTDHALLTPTLQDL